MPSIRSALPPSCALLALLPLLATCDSSTEPAVHDPSRMLTTAPNGEPGVATEVTVEARDTEGRPFTGELPGLAMEVRGENAGASTQLSSVGDGAFELRYTPAAVGFDTLEVTLDGEPVPGSPFPSRVRLVFHAAVGAATLDGVMAAGEWDAATAYPVFAGPLAGSTARFLVDADDLYVLFRVPHPDGTAAGAAGVRFDNTLDLVRSGDDVIGLMAPSTFVDLHFEENIQSDANSHGAGAAASSGEWAFFELQHPLSSGDPEDIDIGRGDGVGVCLVYSSELTFVGSETSFPASCLNAVFEQRLYAELQLPPL